MVLQVSLARTQPLSFPRKRGPSIPGRFLQRRSTPARSVFTGSPLSRGRQRRVIASHLFCARM